MFVPAVIKKMETECQLKPISMDFSSPENGGGFLGGRHGTGFDCQNKNKILAAIYVLLIFAAIKI